MKRNVSVVKLCLYVSECVCSKIIKELPGLVGSGTPCIMQHQNIAFLETICASEGEGNYNYRFKLHLCWRTLCNNFTWANNKIILFRMSVH